MEDGKADATVGLSPREEALLESLFDLVAEFGEDGRILWVNGGYSRILGLKTEDLLGKSGWDTAHPDDRATVPELGGAPSSGTVPYPLRLRTAWGGWRQFEAQHATYRGPDGAIRRLGIARDVTEKWNLEQKLKESEGLYRTLAENAAALVSQIDATGRWTYLNAHHRELLGWEPEALIGTEALERIHPADRKRMADHLSVAALGERSVEQARFVHRDGSLRWFNCSVRPVEGLSEPGNRILVAQDVTQEKLLQQRESELRERLERQKRFEGFGVLAAGVAHDFNNLLASIMSHAELALDESPDAAASLRAIIHAAENAGELCRQLLDSFDNPPLDLQPVAIDELALETIEIASAALPAGVSLHHEAGGDGSAHAVADRAQLHRALVNLIRNGAEAAEACGGQVHVATGTVDADDYVPGSLSGSLKSASHAFVRVSDSGPGIAPEIADRMFEPYFTTKQGGSGLGLAAVLGIVNAHGGVIDVQTRRGKGSKFTILLPAWRPEESLAEGGAAMLERLLLDRVHQTKRLVWFALALVGLAAASLWWS